MRDVKYIILHCTDTPTGRPTTVEDIDSWHKTRGWMRQDSYRSGFNPTLTSIGYHFVIYVDGSVHTGRQVAEVGAHVSGMNSNSIGISMAGNGKYSPAQWDALKELASNLKQSYPSAKILGHYECPTGQAQGKLCPNFNVQLWVAQEMSPDAINIA